MQDDSAPPAAPGPRVCFACGSAAVAIGRLLDEGEGSGGVALVETENDPEALILKGALTAPLQARICGDCGHVELRERGAGALALRQLVRVASSEVIAG